MGSIPITRSSAAVAALLLLTPAASAQQASQTLTVMPAVTVTATRVERDSADLPVSIDTVDARAIRETRPQVNLSEVLNQVPGIVVKNRENYAQDLQISSRGFGARAAFGVRGVRLIADGIPATMPDGQGQAASFSLDSAERIEVLRGPFSSMYGNSSGGVIQIFTADGPLRPTLNTRMYAGSDETIKGALQYGGQHGPLNVNLVTSVFRTDGYRDHSVARREHSHGKLKLDAGSAGMFTLIADALDQPDTQDPLGLTLAQVAQNRRQAVNAAYAFDTRKSVTQYQLGLVHDLKVTPRDSLQMRVYGGDRQVTQYLGIPLAVQLATPTHSGGVVDLDRGYGGAGARWSHSTQAAGTPLDVHLGVDYERMSERRRGFINNFGVAGALRRDEDDTVQSTNTYAQVEWRAFPKALAMAGVRHSRVRFRSEDAFIAPGNPDDSGSVRYSRTSPVAGLSYELSRGVHVYVNAGKGFETPTFAELAYRPGGSPGLNFALKPSVSWHREAGIKIATDTTNVTLAVFRIDVKDEVVVASAAGGRTTFRNAARTERTGAELAWQGRFKGGVEALVALTQLTAEFSEPFASGTPPTVIAGGNRLPGVPGTVFYGELVWRHAASGFHAGAEVKHNGRVYVDDQNSESAPPYTVANVRAGFEQRGKRWRLSEFVRVDNVTDRNYIGSVIVADGNRRFYEPAPGRTWLVGVSGELSF